MLTLRIDVWLHQPTNHIAVAIAVDRAQIKRNLEDLLKVVLWGCRLVKSLLLLTVLRRKQLRVTRL